MAERIWHSLTDKEQGAASEKNVEYQNTVDKEGLEEITSAVVSYKPNGIWEIAGPFGQNDYVAFDMPGAGNTSEPGSPMLIREGIYVALPPGKKCSHISVLDVQEESLPGQYEVLPAPEPVLETEEAHYIKNPDIYGSDSVYPPVYAEYMGEESVMGVRCAQLYIYPMHYRPKQKEVLNTYHIKIKVFFESCDTGTQNKPIANKRWEPLILGYKDLCNDNFYEDEKEKPRLLIITTKELAYALRIYEGIKSFLYNVEMVMAEDIYADYPQLSADEAIMTYLKEEDEKKSIGYVMLGGDISAIPTHKDSGGFVSDSYYCTKGISSAPQFALGRFPAKNKQELLEQCDIASYYDRYFNKKIRNTAVFTTYNRKAYEQCKEEIAGKLSAGSDFHVNKCYDGKCTKKELIDAINAGAGFVNYRGHGNDTKWESKIGLSTTDVPGLDVKRNTPIVFSIACNNNNLYNPDCFGAAWIRNSKAVAFLGASYPSYTTINHYFDKYIWEAIQDQKLTVVGDIYVWATLKLFQNHKQLAADINIREYLLLGDVTADYLADDISHS